MNALRIFARHFFYRNFWVLPCAFLVAFCVSVGLAYRSAAPFAMLATAPMVAGIAFVWGYATHARKNVRYPSLSNLHPRRYGGVWDVLAATPHEARVAACGHGSESAIRDSAVAIVAAIMESASIGQGDDVLEIGCGAGRIGFELAPRCRFWTGADISGNMLAEAAKRLVGMSNVRLVKLQKTGLDEFEASSFDVVYCTNAFDHLEQIDRWLYIREAFRVLRPAGRLYVDSANIQSEVVWTAFARDADLLAAFEPPAFQPRPTTGAELTEYAQRAGFKNVRTQPRGSLVILCAQKPA